jgi:hypothetical protein
MTTATTSPPSTPPLMTCSPMLSDFLLRPQLLTRRSPLPVGRDISRATLTPEHPCGQLVARLQLWGELTVATPVNRSTNL